MNLKALALPLMATLLALQLPAAHAADAPKTNASPVARQTGLVTASDGFTYFYKKDGSMTKGEFVKTDDGAVYYFALNGRGVKQTVKVINKNLIEIWNSAGSTAAFLIIGDKEALMIDGLFGMGDLKQWARFYTDKPIKIALTHGGVDHSGVAYLASSFPEVWVHPGDFEMFRHFGQSPERRFTNDVNESKMVSKVDYYDILTVEDYAEPNPEPVLKAMHDGTRFDLGGLTVETLWSPGHTQGCTSFLLKEPRILISGDCAMPGTRINQTTVEVFRKSAKRYVARQGEWDRVFISHGVGDTEVKTDMFENLLALADLVLSGRLRGVQVPLSTDNIFGDQSGKLSTRGVAGTEKFKNYYLVYDQKKVLNAMD